jgi:prepilin-type N-terminal cleavage/methylation domain-containing protein
MLRPRAQGPTRHGFTLVELLVVIAVIAVLIGMLAPVIGSGYRAGRNIRCLSNHHQIALAWIMYTGDHRYFPSGSSPELTWGGVDWYSEESYEFGGLPLSPNRPVNEYIGSNERDQSRAEVFHCPSDNGLFKWGTQGERYYYSFQPEYHDPYASNPRYESRAEDASENLFSVVGTSYRANDWIWVTPGSINGGFLSPGAPTSKNTPDMVTDHSRFVLVSDGGMSGICRADLQTLGQFPLAYSWWHGEGRNNFSFLDGSGRGVHTTHGTATTTDYTFYLDDRLHEPWSRVFAWFNGGNPPRP